MAKNKLSDLNDLLFQTLENLVDPEMNEDGELINEMTTEKATVVAKIGQVIINNAKVQLSAMELVASGKLRDTHVLDIVDQSSPLLSLPNKQTN